MDEIELVWDRVRKTPAFQAGPQIAQMCLEQGLLCSVRRGARCCALCHRLPPPRASSIMRQRSLSEPSSGLELDRVVTTIDRCASSQCM
jgi:hypothetical protein